MIDKSLELIAAGVLGLGLTFAGMPAFLGWMRRLGWGQQIRPEGPADHQSKAGTPTMGGAVLVPAALIASLWARQITPDLVVFWAVTLGCFGLGLLDDLTKVLKNRNLGLKARHKLAAQFAIGLGVGVYLLATRPQPGFEVPFIGFVGAAWFVLALSLAVVVSTSNAVNVTDGLDGLAAGTMATASLVYSIVCLHQGKPELAAAAAAMVGSCLGFLWFNCYPARLFMGDTGSLALGGGLATLALLSDTPFLLVVIGGVFVLEALSVVLQVSYFKLTGGQRIFRMSPVHHHFGLTGMHEVQVTIRFWLVGAVFGLAGLYLYFGGCGA